MSRYCLDTSAYSHFKRGHADVVERIDSAAWIGLPSIVIGELRIGFALGRQRDRNDRELEEFLASPVVTRLDVDAVVAGIYAEIVVALRESGTPLPTNDIWIAATAAAHGATVLTFDEHFGRIGRVGSMVLN